MQAIANQNFALGLKTLVRLCTDQKPLDWFKAKLSTRLFKGEEVEVFTWIDNHVKTYHSLPKLETLSSQFPIAIEVLCPEPSNYYVAKLENRFFYDVINATNIDSQLVLKANQEDVAKAETLMREALADINEQKYRLQLVDVGTEGAKMVFQAYHKIGMPESICSMGWPYLDDMSGGAMPGDIIVTVGRPAAGKTYLTLYGALKNWRAGKRVLLVSMEMAPLPIIQRVSAMYSSTSITQLKLSGFSTNSYKKFKDSVFQMPLEVGKFYVVDGNLAADVEDIYLLAAQLHADAVYIDGAYLLKHPNKRLDRYTKVAENIELQKKMTTSLGIPTFPSYQLSREASKKKSGKQEVGLEDIGYSDAIGQIGSVVMGLFQEEGIETMNKRKVAMMKGRNGEIGSFDIHWKFDVMNFDQITMDGEKPESGGELEFL